jgi:thymidylate kinase
LLIDPRRYRYGGSMIAARLVGKLMPPPDLWVFLDAPALVLQARKQEVPIEETERQRHAYLEFVKSQKDYRIVDASQALSQVIADAEAAITGVMKGVDGKRG